MKEKKTEAQREAKRLYNRFHSQFKKAAENYIGSFDNLIRELAKKASLIAADEIKKKVLQSLTRTVYDIEYKAELKQFYKSVRKAIKEI